jgi:hypothetical protein
MKTHSGALLISALATVATAQTEDSQVKPPADTISHRYCEVDKEITTPLIKFKINLTNAGGLPVVFYPEPYPPLLVSGTLNDLRRRKYEFQLHAPDVFGLPDENTKRRRVPHIIRAGETVESTTMEITVPTPRTSQYSKFEALDPGNHYVQLVMDLNAVDTTTFVRAISPPVEISVEKNPELEKCQ